MKVNNVRSPCFLIPEEVDDSDDKRKAGAPTTLEAEYSTLAFVVCNLFFWLHGEQARQCRQPPILVALRQPFVNEVHFLSLRPAVNHPPFEGRMQWLDSSDHNCVLRQR